MKWVQKVAELIPLGIVKTKYIRTSSVVMVTEINKPAVGWGIQEIKGEKES